MPINWVDLITKTCQTLIKLDIRSFPTSPLDINFGNTIIVSYQEYERLANASIVNLGIKHDLRDAVLIRKTRPGLNLILYNNAMYSKRKGFSLWHEIGHVECDHTQHGSKQEAEANFFASQIIAPSVLIRELLNRGYPTDANFIATHFGMSNEAARIRIENFTKYEHESVHEYDDVLLLQFTNFLDSKFPSQTLSHNFENDF